MWADLGCGNGLAAGAALGDRRPPHAVLIDLEAEVVGRAVQELGIEDTVMLDGDLIDPAALARVSDALLRVDGDRVVSCFEVIEHLSTFVPFLEWSGALARDDAATFVLSVPNDAFWTIENPYHAARWGEGAFEELRRLLPGRSTRCCAKWRSPDRPWWPGTTRPSAMRSVCARAARAVWPAISSPPSAHDMRSWPASALAVQLDQLDQRSWERQRESNLAVAEARVQALDAERAEWRAYIHELERELGRPLSGVEQNAQS